ncbi:MAG: helix-turn-helix transcriptional regulator [Oscillospiraceae bacterium]|jgi:transcriptional regulator with XRE-family HTH domain|nr:helix-turn-helix transcriptional regulator [Oscillospiraceae bacterium]
MKIYDYKGKKNVCGERVRQARVLQHLTQSELAARLQIEEVILERDSISRIEAGTRFVADFELLVLAKVLRVEPTWLLDAGAEM